MFDGTHINLLVAFLAGFSTFFASCLLPLVPVYLAYLSGLSLTHPQASSHRWQIVKASLFFVFGFVTIFVFLGEALYLFSHLVSFSRTWLDRLGGILFILFGLNLLNIFKPKWLNQEFKLNPNHWFTHHRYFHAFLVGLTFGFAWTPCIGPVLGVILFWASRQATAWLGFKLLLVFGFGLGLPFILVGFAFEPLIPWLKKHANLSRYFQLISGLIILLAGFLLLFDQLQSISFFILNLIHLNSFTP